LSHSRGSRITRRRKVIFGSTGRWKIDSSYANAINQETLVASPVASAVTGFIALDWRNSRENFLALSARSVRSVGVPE
jgi:hypothetical protein